ncbi:MAG: matrixin family metalloprotease, partial [Candidatus Stahlbacteria bacterium]|nr:matrixin family metalloprotease [Candidatus Stahlbacteria bacterium]
MTNVKKFLGLTILIFLGCDVDPQDPERWCEYEGRYWHEGRAIFQIAPNLLDWESEIKSAANTWDTVNSYFRFYYHGIGEYNLISKGQVTCPGALAETYARPFTNTDMIYKAYTKFNENLNWSTTGEANKYDVRTVILHEFGHWLNLKDLIDTLNKSQIMYGEYMGIRYSLGQGDKEGINNIYGIGSPLYNPSAPEVSVVSDEVIISWNDVGGADGYFVGLSHLNNPNFPYRLSLGKTAVSCNLEINTNYFPDGAGTYYVRIVAYQDVTISTDWVPSKIPNQNKRYRSDYSDEYSFSITGSSHNGADWVIASDTTLYGLHWNIGTFTIPAGVTVKVKPYNGSDTTGWAIIKAKAMNIVGTLKSDTAGYLASEGTGQGIDG